MVWAADDGCGGSVRDEDLKDSLFLQLLRAMNQIGDLEGRGFTTTSLCGDCPSLSVKKCLADWIRCEMHGQYLDGDIAVETFVARFVNFTHTARADFSKNLVVSQSLPGHMSCSGLSHTLSDWLNQRN